MRRVLHWLVPLSLLTLLMAVGWLLDYLEVVIRDVEPIAVRVPPRSRRAGIEDREVRATDRTEENWIR